MLTKPWQLYVVQIYQSQYNSTKTKSPHILAKNYFLCDVPRKVTFRETIVNQSIVFSWSKFWINIHLFLLPEIITTKLNTKLLKIPAKFNIKHIIHVDAKIKTVSRSWLWSWGKCNHGPEDVSHGLKMQKSHQMLHIFWQCLEIVHQIVSTEHWSSEFQTLRWDMQKIHRPKKYKKGVPWQPIHIDVHVWITKPVEGMLKSSYNNKDHKRWKLQALTL